MRARKSVSLITQHPPAVGRVIAQRGVQIRLCHDKTVMVHGFVKWRAFAAVRVNDQHLRMGRSMSLNKSRELLWMITLIQHIAAYDQIKLTQERIGALPMPADIWQGVHIIEQQIGIQEALCIRVIVGGGDSTESPVNNQTRQAQATTNFKKSKIGDWPSLHHIGHFASRWPHQAEQRPSG